MNTDELENRIKNLSQAYYSTGTSDVSDKEFDDLFDELREVDPDSELLDEIGSGYEVELDTTPGEKFPHRYGLVGSLKKARTWKELEPLYKSGQLIDVSAKLDGLSVVLYYKCGRLVQAMTRGDGKIGIDITNKVKFIMNADIGDLQFTGAVRGEIIMDNDSFDEFILKHPEAKSPRNSAAGLIGNKEITDDLKYLKICVYSVIGYDNGFIGDVNLDVCNNFIETHFPYTAPRVYMYLSEDGYMDQFEELMSLWSEKLPIDGLVLSSIDIETDGNAIIQHSQAFKFKSEIAETKVLEIEWNLSKTRYLVPRIRVEPVELAGSTVQYCTGYNAKYVKDNNINIGSTLEIERRGEVIPNINKVISVNSDSDDPIHPDYCPVCSSLLEWKGVHLLCVNDSCSGASEQDLIVWLEFLAPMDNFGTVLKLKFLKNMFNHIPSIEELMDSQKMCIVSGRSGTHEKMFAQMIDTLVNSRIKLVDAIRALNIPRFGEITTEKLSKYPELVKSILDYATKPYCPEQLDTSYIESIIGQSNSVSLFENLSKFARLDLISNRIIWKEDNDKIEPKCKVAITGKLSVKRSQFESELKSAGFSVGDMSKDTKYLITDDPNSASSKNAKANEWGIDKITELEFREKYL